MEMVIFVGLFCAAMLGGLAWMGKHVERKRTAQKSRQARHAASDEDRSR